MRTLLIAVVGVSLVTSAVAQPASVSGTWSVTGQGARESTADGENWSIAAISGTLTLEQTGTEITGSWQGQMPNSWSVTGRVDDAGYEVMTEWREIPVARNDTKSMMRARWVFRGSVSGDTMSGTLTLEVERGNRPQPFTAKRAP